MLHSEQQIKLFNFLARRVIGPAFVVVGLIVAAFGVKSILPGGTVLVDGVPTDDLVFRWLVFLLPLLVSLLGVALFKVAPFTPSKK